MGQRKQAHLTQRALLALLRNWNALNSALMGLDERQVRLLLAYEKRTKNRLSYALRLHARLSRLRGERERRALVVEA